MDLKRGNQSRYYVTGKIRSCSPVWDISGPLVIRMIPICGSQSLSRQLVRKSEVVLVGEGLAGGGGGGCLGPRGFVIVRGSQTVVATVRVCLP